MSCESSVCNSLQLLLADIYQRDSTAISPNTAIVHRTMTL
jgi:hypothetical protein